MIGGYQKGESDSSKGSENVSILHNLMAHDSERTPLMQMCGIAQVINNVTYNPEWTFAHQQDNCTDTTANNTINWIGNYHKKGPSSTSSTDLKVLPADSGTYSHVSHVYVSGNIGPSRTSSSQPDSDWVESGSRSYIVTTPASAPSVTTTDAQTAYNDVLADGGAGNSKGLNCDGSWYNRRDAIDVRVINDVKNGTGKIIDDPSQVGGWITPATGTGCTDSDHDGMPDAWETAHGLNPNDATDGPKVTSDGYTNLEHYLNGTSVAPGGTATPTPTVAPTPVGKPGDANGDGVVNEADYTIWFGNYGKSITTGVSGGDFDLNGKVDGVDYVIWLNNYNVSGPTPTSTPTHTPTPIATPTHTPTATPTTTATPTAAPGTAFNFISWSDTEISLEYISPNLSNQAKAFQPKFTIYNGDADLGFPTSWMAALNGNNNNGMSAYTFVVRGNGNSGQNFSSYFNFATVASTVGATNYIDATIPQADETYSFDYGNSRFIGIDVPDCGQVITSPEIAWAQNRITDAEVKGLTHVFLFMHGMIWYADNHTDCTVPTALVTMISAHPIVTAEFVGHEHIKAVLNFGPSDSRISMSHPFREIFTSGAGGDTYPCNSGRLASGDYCGSYEGFANVTVNGNNITVDFYQTGSTTPVKTVSFSK